MGFLHLLYFSVFMKLLLFIIFCHSCVFLLIVILSEISEQDNVFKRHMIYPFRTYTFFLLKLVDRLSGLS